MSRGGESGDRGIAPPQNAARKKRQSDVRQSLRHGLRPCHLPLTREAKPPQTPRYPHPCRGRYSHRPGDPAPPQTSNFEIAAVRRAKSPALRNGENGAANRATATLRYPHPCRGRFYIGPVCGGAGARGRDESRPYESILRFRPFGTTATARATVGRDAPSRRTLPTGPLVKGGWPRRKPRTGGLPRRKMPLERSVSPS